MNLRYRVELSQTERHELNALLSGGRHAARKLKRAQILLAADAGASDEEIARNVGVGGSTVYRTKRRFVLGNLEAALSEEPRPGADRKLSGKEEALLVATACSSSPKGRARWTLELLADELVKLTEHDNISRETVSRRLAENELKPWRKDMWCIPQVDGEFVARMEDVLAAAGLVGSDFDTVPFLLMNGDYRPMAFRERNYAAAAAMNASPTRKVGPALVVSAEDPSFKGKFNGHTHMGMLGSTALEQFDVFLDWAEKNIPNPIVKTSCTKRAARRP